MLTSGVLMSRPLPNRPFTTLPESHTSLRRQGEMPVVENTCDHPCPVTPTEPESPPAVDDVVAVASVAPAAGALAVPEDLAHPFAASRRHEGRCLRRADDRLSDDGGE